MILDEIVGKRKEQLARELQRTDRETMRKLALRTEREVYSFPDALKTGRLSIIAEVKKASPSKSVICADFHPVEQAAAYERAGADAISCLTEEHYFQGSSDYFRAIREAVSIPMLRKDFIIDTYQIDEARVMGADAILLIAAIFTNMQRNWDCIVCLKHTTKKKWSRCLLAVQKSAASITAT